MTATQPNRPGEPHAALADARVLLVGAGGLGSPAALVLAAAGVGTLVIADPDAVEPSNLNRQILHRTRDLGRPKVESARTRIARRAPAVCVEAHPVALTADNLAGFFDTADFVIDGTDGTAAKFLLNDGAVLRRRPYTYAGVLGFEGQAMTVLPGESACLRCLFPEPPPAGTLPSCRAAGIVGAVAGVIGAIQAAEALAYLRRARPALAGRLLTYHAWHDRWRTVPVARNPDCPLCGVRPSITALGPAAPEEMGVCL
jgi:adenylyltransferase/sulfurtransferase